MFNNLLRRAWRKVATGRAPRLSTWTSLIQPLLNIGWPLEKVGSFQNNTFPSLLVTILSSFEIINFASSTAPRARRSRGKVVPGLESGGRPGFYAVGLVEASWRRNQARTATHAFSTRPSFLTVGDRPSQLADTVQAEHFVERTCYFRIQCNSMYSL